VLTPGETRDPEMGMLAAIPNTRHGQKVIELVWPKTETTTIHKLPKSTQD
jgi:hypothetical protein